MTFSRLYFIQSHRSPADLLYYTIPLYWVFYIISFIIFACRQSSDTMKERKILSMILLTSLTFLLMARFTTSCNQMLCASIVSKCMLTQSCKCDMKNCTCCVDCYNCLSWLWKECCSCVGKDIPQITS